MTSRQPGSILRLLAGSSDPTAPVQGQTFLSTAANLIRYYTGSAWRTLVTAEDAQTISGNKTYTGDLTGVAVDRLLHYARRQALGGGGSVSISGAWELGWTARFISISQGREAGTDHLSGYVGFTQPAAGTVITGVGGAANVTVTSGGIPMTAWTAIWYVPTDATTGTFYVSQYTANWMPGRDWILVAWRDNDPLVCRVANGLVLKAGESVNVATTTAGNVMDLSTLQLAVGGKRFQRTSGSYAVELETPNQAATDTIYMRALGRAVFGYDNGVVVMGDGGASKPLSFRTGGNNSSVDEAMRLTAAGLSVPGMVINAFSGGTATSSSSTTFAPVSSGAQGYFYAPPSGRVLIAYQMYLKGSGTVYAYGDIEVNNGNVPGGGTPYDSPSTGNLVVQGSTWVRASLVRPFSSLVAGNPYAVRLMFASQTAGTTVQASHGQINIFPLP